MPPSSASRSTEQAESSTRPTTTGRCVREVCTRYDVLLIADEIITGFCRTGRWFGLSHWNVKPDMLSFAKGVTSGYLPLGGIMVSKAIKDVMDAVKPEDRWMHASTYSAHPTCCAVALKNLEIMQREQLWENAAKMGERLHTGPRGSLRRSPERWRRQRRQRPLAAVEFVEDRATKEELRRRPEDRPAPSGRDDEARRRHADAPRGRRPIPRQATWCSSRRRSSSPRGRSIGWSAWRETPSRSCWVPRAFQLYVVRAIQAHLNVRDELVHTRGRTISMVRAMTRAEGLRIRSGSPETFLRRLAAVELSPSLAATVEPLCQLMGCVNEQLRVADLRVRDLVTQDPTIARLTTLPTIGPVTASVYVAALDDVHRFRRAGQVANYLGLVPRQVQLG